MPEPAKGLTQAVQRVLVLEDHPMQRDVLEQALRRAGVPHVFGAADAGSALELLQRLDEIDLIISDLMMEGMDGVEFLRAVSKLPKPPSVVLCSAADAAIVDAVEQMGHGLGLRMIGRLNKPAKWEQVMAVLRACLPLDQFEHANTVKPVTVLRSPLRDIESSRTGHEFALLYQPKLAVMDGRLLGVEARAHWRHPRSDTSAPTPFQPVLASAGLIDELLWPLLERVLLDAREWSAVSQRLPLAIDISARSLRDSTLPDRLAELCNEYRLPTEWLALELNETALLADMNLGLAVSSRLRMKGFGLVLDHFGAGYSAFEMLAKFPFDEIKLDPSLVHSADTSKAQSLLAGVIELIRRLGLRAVAEGINTEADWQLIKALQPDGAQGDYFAAAMGSHELQLWFRKLQAPLA